MASVHTLLKPEGTPLKIKKKEKGFWWWWEVHKIQTWEAVPGNSKPRNHGEDACMRHLQLEISLLDLNLFFGPPVSTPPQKILIELRPKKETQGGEKCEAKSDPKTTTYYPLFFPAVITSLHLNNPRRKGERGEGIMYQNMNTTKETFRVVNMKRGSFSSWHYLWHYSICV